jgi:putative transposase
LTKVNLNNKYNPRIHHRRSVRLKGYDYSQAGLYFITICCKDKECLFGKIVNDEIVLNEYGHIAYNEWIKLPERFLNCELDVFQIMPNHIHGIIVLTHVENAAVGINNIDTAIGAGLVPALRNESNETSHQNNTGSSQVGTIPTTSIGNIVGTYKSLTANKYLDAAIANRPKTDNTYISKIWQRNYFEHIIRNEQSYHNISKYIINNPVKWKEDKFYK